MVSEIEIIEKKSRYWQLPDDTLVNTKTAACLINKSPSTLKFWRTSEQMRGPNWVIGRPVSYTIGSLKAYIRQQQSNTYDGGSNG